MQFFSSFHHWLVVLRCGVHFIVLSFVCFSSYYVFYWWCWLLFFPHFLIFLFSLNGLLVVCAFSVPFSFTTLFKCTRMRLFLFFFHYYNCWWCCWFADTFFCVFVWIISTNILLGKHSISWIVVLYRSNSTSRSSINNRNMVQLKSSICITFRFYFFLRAVFVWFECFVFTCNCIGMVKWSGREQKQMRYLLQLNVCVNTFYQLIRNLFFKPIRLHALGLFLRSFLVVFLLPLHLNSNNRQLFRWHLHALNYLIVANDRPTRNHLCRNIVLIYSFLVL